MQYHEKNDIVTAADAVQAVNISPDGVSTGSKQVVKHKKGRSQMKRELKGLLNEDERQNKRLRTE